MKTYLVGGAVRDRLLGLTSKDKDYLVLDSTPEEMKSLGFSQVGSRFPIYLHPKTKEEYAFPRGSSLEEDLFRRDLTINSMAIDADGKLIDPHGGSADLKNKVLRHTSEAFAEDPFRVYRVFRFKARFPDFLIAPETMELMKKIILSEEFKTMDSERMIKELRVVLSLPKPSLFFEGLKEVGALTYFFPELEAHDWNQNMLVLDKAAMLTSDLIIRYSALVHNLGIDHVQTLGSRILAPNDWTEAAMIVTKFHLLVHRLLEMNANSIVEMFYDIDAFRKPYLINILAIASEAKNKSFNSTRLVEYFEYVRRVSYDDITPGLTGKAVGDAIREKRILVLKERLAHE